MNNLIFNQSILEKLLDETSFKSEAADLLNEIIDNELSKENPNCDLIDECVEALEFIENGDYLNVIPFAVKAERASGKNRRVIGILIACAVILSSCIGAVAVNNSIEKKKAEVAESEISEQTTASAATTKTTASTSSNAAETTTTIITTTTISTAVESKVENIRLKFDDDFKDEYEIGEKLSLKGISVIAVLSDGTEKNVDISDCDVIKNKSFGQSERYETITVEYEGKTQSFKVRFLRTEDTKVLNSIYAAFPDDFDFTSADIDKIDLSGMEVYAVYSDKSERKLSANEYTVETEKLPGSKSAMITITHNGVFTSFGIKERNKGENNAQ